MSRQGASGSQTPDLVRGPITEDPPIGGWLRRRSARPSSDDRLEGRGAFPDEEGLPALPATPVRREAGSTERQVKVMNTFATVLRRTALVVTALFALGGLMFALGYAFEDLAIGAALVLTAAIVVPLVGLTILAVRRPDVAPVVLATGVGLFAAYAVLDMFVDVIKAPAIPVIALVLALPIAVLGQRRAVWAGGLMLVLAAFPFLQLLVRMFGEAALDRPPLGALLTGSTGIVVVPLAVLGILFLIAGGLGHRAPRAVQPPAREPQPR